MAKTDSLILVVDDNRAILEMLHTALEMAGFGVVTAADGTSALALLDKHRPDLMILDVRMPEMDGFQVLELARRRTDAPVIMLTGLREPAFLDRALTAGADDYVTKPFSLLELISRIRAKLRRNGGATS